MSAKYKAIAEPVELVVEMKSFTKAVDRARKALEKFVSAIDRFEDKGLFRDPEKEKLTFSLEIGNKVCVIKYSDGSEIRIF